MSGSFKTDVLIIGSGFASAILARALAQSGVDVLMVERGEHPRFSLGESTTPLANLALERLALRFGWRDLWDLASWGRWQKSHPMLRCGLKRGFTFFEHASNGSGRQTSGPVMVAASGSDEVADTQWMRSDVDAFLVEKALAAGARLLEQTEVVRLRIRADYSKAVFATGVQRSRSSGTYGVSSAPSGVRVAREIEPTETDQLETKAAITETADGRGACGKETGIKETGIEETETKAVEIRADFVVDGSGGAGLLAAALGLERRHELPFETSLLFAHFEGLPVPSLGVEPSAGQDSRLREMPSEPYPVQWSAVHHLLDVGWMYELRFDDGVTSCGWLLDHQRCQQEGVTLEQQGRVDAQALHSRLLERYPSLGLRFEGAKSIRPLVFRPSCQWRLEQAAGRHFALLPQAFAFYDPMFSTGIAWSLLAVERLCDVLLAGLSGSGSQKGLRVTQQDQLVKYDQLLKQEGDHLEHLLSGAYAVLHDLEAFGWYSQVYFAVASFSESQQRLSEDSREAWHWHGLLGATDEISRNIVHAARGHALEALSGHQWSDLMPSLIAPRNIAGLADRSCHPLYRADPETVIGSAHKLGMDSAQVRRRLPRLLGKIPFSQLSGR